MPRTIDEDAVKLMNLAARAFVGSHDFSGFMSEGSDVDGTVRTISSLTVSKCDNLIEIRISADGFLYNMVRIIVGTLIDVAYGRTKPDDMQGIIASCDRSLAGMTAPPEGLYLNRVIY